MSEEQDYLDNMPENLQFSERYENAESNVDDLDSSLDSIDDAVESILAAVDPVKQRRNKYESI